MLNYIKINNQLVKIESYYKKSKFRSPLKPTKEFYRCNNYLVELDHYKFNLMPNWFYYGMISVVISTLIFVMST
jgi:hypothetical protein